MRLRSKRGDPEPPICVGRMAGIRRVAGLQIEVICAPIGSLLGVGLEPPERPRSAGCSLERTRADHSDSGLFKVWRLGLVVRSSPSGVIRGRRGLILLSVRAGRLRIHLSVRLLALSAGACSPPRRGGAGGSGRCGGGLRRGCGSLGRARGGIATGAMVHRRPHRNRRGGRVQCGGLRQYRRPRRYGGTDGLGSPADSPPSWWRRETGSASAPSWDRWIIRAQSSGRVPAH
jgi:hypothetical protein